MTQSFSTLAEMNIDNQTLSYHSLPALSKNMGVDLNRMPYAHKILLENLLRLEDGQTVKRDDILALVEKKPNETSSYEIQFTPSRVLLQDFTGVPVVVDLAAMRDATEKRKGNPDWINPVQPVDLVIDHSVQVDYFAEKNALTKNAALEFERNQERYEFLKWGQKAFQNFQVVPPATGICHQVNLEFLSHVAMTGEHQGQTMIYPDTLVGTDSHTPMINALGVVGWGVGGIEAEAAMLGQPITMLIPDVIGFEMTGQLPAGATATDLVLTVTQMLRAKGVVGKFVEFFGQGVSTLTVADRATISNMAPEYGATIGVFPVDDKTIEYLKLTGRPERAHRAEQYYKSQGMFGTQQRADYTDVVSLDLSTVEPSLAGPAKPHDRSSLSHVRKSFRHFLSTRFKEELREHKKERLDKWMDEGGHLPSRQLELEEKHPDKDLGPLGAQAQVNDPNGYKYNLVHGSVVIAAVTSCTNTSNPDLMVAAALLARKAHEKGLEAKPWVKTSFAPGSKVVTEYLESAGLMGDLDRIGFDLVGYGCTTCIGNSGPLPPHIDEAIDQGKIATASVLSGNRNFEARIHPNVLANYLASPPLVIAYALAGNINMNFRKDPVGYNKEGEAVYLNEIWPSSEEIQDVVGRHVTDKSFAKVYSDVFSGDKNWQEIRIKSGTTYEWQNDSTYIKNPPFLEEWLIQEAKQDSVQGAKILGLFGDFVTTDHISPAGRIPADSPAGTYLIGHGVQPKDFNSYGARRGNHEVMMRGTFANVRIKNKMVDKEGGWTKVDDKVIDIFSASQSYRDKNIPLVVLAGKQYGTGSSRDWAAKGTRLLGVRAVVAESFERIHRSNLIGMGVIPLEFPKGQNLGVLGLTGEESIDILELNKLTPKCKVPVVIHKSSGEKVELDCQLRADTATELKYIQAGGILPYVLNDLINQKPS